MEYVNPVSESEIIETHHFYALPVNTSDNLL